MCCVWDIVFEIKCSVLGIVNVFFFDNKLEIVIIGLEDK